MKYQNEGSTKCIDVWEVVEKGFSVLENKATLSATQKESLEVKKERE